MTKNFFIYILIILLFTTLTINSLEEQSKIDEIIKKKDQNALRNFLNEYKGKENYSEIEKYIISKVKELVLDGEFQYAKVITSIILEYNMDNTEAQEIYLAIEDKEKKETEVKTKKITFDNFLFAFDYGAVDFMLSHSQFYDDYYEELKVNFKYGMSLDFAFYFKHPYIAVGVEAFFDTYFVSLYPASSGTPFFYRIIFPITTPLIRVPLYFSFGLAHQIYYFGENTTPDVLITNLISPVIGLKLTRWFFNKYVGIDASFHYYLISPFTSYFDAAFDSTLSLLIRFYQLKRFGFIIRTDINPFFLIQDGKLEYNVKFQISFGIGINEK